MDRESSYDVNTDPMYDNVEGCLAYAAEVPTSNAKNGLVLSQLRSLDDYDSPTARSAMRTAIHNIAYAVVNSNALQGYAPGAVQKIHMSPWQIGLYVADVVIALLLAGGVFWMVWRTRDAKAHPERYKSRKNRAKKKS